MVAAPSNKTVAIPHKGDLRNRDRIENYTSLWDKDSAKDTAAHRENRIENYEQTTNSYYDGATELYEYGWGTSVCHPPFPNYGLMRRCTTRLFPFHFCRYYKGEAFYQAIARHEHFLAARTGIKPKMRVLDVGCGVGGPAREIARFTDAHITGLNNNAFQVERATRYTAKAGLSGQVEFVKGDFTRLAEQFGENSFDAVYAIEATCHSPTAQAVYGEIFKVLKPGGTFGVYEWCMTDAWDASNPEHKKIQHGIEIGDGIADMRTVAVCRNALQEVGFEIVEEDDLADRGDEISWFYPLQGDIRKVQTLWDVVMVWRMTWFGKVVTQSSVWALEKVGLVPKGTHDVGEALKTAADALVEGGRLKLFTPMQLFVCKKPAAN